MKESLKQQIRFSKIYGILGFAALTTYGFINIYLNDWPSAIFELLMALLIIFASYLTQKKMSLNFTFFLGLIPLFALCIHNFYSGGFEGSGIFWTFLFPVACFFFLEKIIALLFVTFYILSTLLIYLGGLLGIVEFLYSNTSYLTYLIAFTIITTFSYIFKNGWTIVENKLEVNNSNLDKINKELLEKNKMLEESYVNADQTLKKLKDANKKLEEAAEFNLKREISISKLKNKIRNQ